MKKVLFSAHYVEGLREAWETYGYQVQEPDMPLHEQSEEQIMRQIAEQRTVYNNAEIIVFSLNFYPVLAECCYQNKVVYISWAVDCPMISLWSKTVFYETNRIFAFDYNQYQTLLCRKMQNVFYLPLAADVTNFQRRIAEDAGHSREKFSSDVSFVGNLYNDTAHSMYDKITYLPPYIRGWLDAMMAAQRKVWGADLISEGLTEEVLTGLKEYVKLDLGDRYIDGTYEIMLKSMLGQKITQLERKEVCSFLARLFDFVLYTECDTSYDAEICNRGRVDYRSEMPLVFHYSKINVHITMRTIPSGVPQRVLDVLACGGFLMTNYQPEIAEYFVDGEDLVVYTDFEDMYAKIAYYLEHEEERARIAERGFQKVREAFDYGVRIGSMVEMLC